MEKTTLSSPAPPPSSQPLLPPSTFPKVRASRGNFTQMLRAGGRGGGRGGGEGEKGERVE
eukprot:763293-Hanusia_phi.AAC.3